MSRSRNTPGTPAPGSRRGAAASVAPSSDAAKLAHELSNLVDGSLRNLSLAMATLDEPPVTPTAQQDADDTARRLRSSAEAMRQMATLLHRFMEQGARGRSDAATLHWSESTLGDAADYAAKMIEPMAATRGIAVDIDLADAADLPAGPLYPVIANALRNAVEAIADGGRSGESGGGGRIELRARRERDTVVMEIADDGPGVRGDLPRDETGLVHGGVTSKSGGHGMGLALSRQIVESIGGTIVLGDREPRGAVLSVRWKA